jgi:hypothetical protein
MLKLGCNNEPTVMQHRLEASPCVFAVLGRAISSSWSNKEQIKVTHLSKHDGGGGEM